MFHGLNLNIKGEFKPMSYTTYNIQDFNNQIRKQTFVDRKFQRRLVWKEKNKKDYLRSLFRNSAESPMMLFDIASGVSYCDSELDKAELIEIPWLVHVHITKIFSRRDIVTLVLTVRIAPEQ